jgi:glycosyltransferase involved in cell wall biosynthesis
MKIVHVGWGHWPEHRLAGPIIYLHRLALTQVRAGEDVTIVCASEREIPGAGPYATLTDVVEGIPYVHLCNRPAKLHDFWNPLREAHDPDCERAFDEVLADLRPDIVHVHNFVGLSFDVVAAAKRHSGAALSSLHNYIPVCSRDDLFFADSERCGGPLVRPCRLCLGTLVDQENYVARHAAAVKALNDCDRVLAVSNRVAEIYGEQGVDPATMAVDRCGTPAGERLWRRLGNYRVAAAEAGDEQPIGDRALRLVFFGAGLPRKGAMHLLQAVRALSDPSRAEINIYGGMGPADQERLGGFLGSAPQAVRDAIHFRGGFSQDDLEGILRDADAAVLTPRWEDNGPQTVFEALSAGLPVLGSRVGGIPDVVEHGRNGLLVEESDTRALAAAIERLIDEPGLLARLRAGIVAPTRMSEHARSLRNFYAEALGEERTEPHVFECSTLEDVTAAVATAVADAGRRGAVLVAAGADDQAYNALASLRGDLSVRGLDGTKTPDERRAETFPSTGWVARWPSDAEPLAQALAVATAFPDALGELEIGVAGSLVEAGEQTLQRLARAGIGDTDLPSVLIRPASAEDKLPIAELPARLAQAAGSDALPGEFWIGDDHGDPVSLAAFGLPDDGHPRHLALVADQLDGVRDLAARGPLTFVSASPLARAGAEALRNGHSLEVHDRADGAAPLAAAEVVIVDGRRPEDLALAGEVGRHGSPAVVVRYAARLAAPALEAFGLREVARDGAGGVLATPIGRP